MSSNYKLTIEAVNQQADVAYTAEVRYALRGASTYEIAVENGFVGSEQEWIDTILADSATNALSANTSAANAYSYMVAANTSAAAANSFMVSANNASLLAVSARDAANTYMISANNSAVAANNSANSAYNYMVSANNSAIAANTHMINANTYMQNANTYMRNANTYMINANTYMQNANTYMHTANGYAVSANNSAASAALSANTATTAAAAVGRITPTVATGVKTLGLADVGKFIVIDAGSVVIPGEGEVSFTNGDTIGIYFDAVTTSNLPVSLNSGTLRLSGTELVGNRTVSGRTYATLIKIKTAEWVIMGAGVS